MGIRVVVAEDSVLLRQGVESVLAASGDISVVAAAADLPGLLEAVAEHDPDVVLTDIRMPPTGTDEGIAAAARFRAERPAMGVLVLSQYAEPAFAIALLDPVASGRGYLLKERLADGAGALVGDPNRRLRRVRGRPGDSGVTRGGPQPAPGIAAGHPHTS